MHRPSHSISSPNIVSPRPFITTAVPIPDAPEQFIARPRPAPPPPEPYDARHSMPSPGRPIQTRPVCRPQHSLSVVHQLEESLGTMVSQDDLSASPAIPENAVFGSVRERSPNKISFTPPRSSTPVAGVTLNEIAESISSASKLPPSYPLPSPPPRASRAYSTIRIQDTIQVTLNSESTPERLLAVLLFERELHADEVSRMRKRVEQLEDEAQRRESELEGLRWMLANRRNEEELQPSPEQPPLQVMPDLYAVGAGRFHSRAGLGLSMVVEATPSASSLASFDDVPAPSLSPSASSSSSTCLLSPPEALNQHPEDASKPGTTIVVGNQTSSVEEVMGRLRVL